MLTRAYSILEVKSVDTERRVITGLATTPEPDRVGDIVEPLGVKFVNPLPLLLYHDSRQPVGHARFVRATPQGIEFEASIADIPQAGKLKDRVDEAWHSIKAELIKGVSIGFRALEDGIELLKSGGLRFTKTEVMELSLVTIPANASATIHTIKSFDAPHLAASGTSGEAIVSNKTPVSSGTPVVRMLPSRSERIMKSLSEQITGYQSTRDQKFQEKSALMTTAADAGLTLDESQSEQYDGLDAEVKALDVHIRRLQALQDEQKAAATPAVGNTPAAAATSRGSEMPVIQLRSNDEPGIGFAKSVLCKAASFLSQGSVSPLDVAKARYPDNDRVITHLKATIPAGTTTGVTWAAPFIDPTNLASEFIDFLRPMTILGKFGTNGIPGLRRVPFNVRILGQTSGGDAYWVAEGAPKPVTKFDFNAITLGFHKVATIAVITRELARFSVPGAERIVRDSLAKAVSGRIDADLFDPALAAVAGVNPASLTNGLTAMTPSGTTADAARSDLARIVKQYLDNNNNVSNLVLIMPASLALSLSVMRNSLGQREFNDVSINGGTVEGIPVITSQYVANTSGGGNLVIAVNADDILLADDGNVSVDISTQASIQMLDNPTNSSSTGTATSVVSLWQTNSIGLLAEREITWAKARSTAVVYMDDVNWGSIGSPA